MMARGVCVSVFLMIVPDRVRNESAKPRRNGVLWNSGKKGASEKRKFRV